MFLRKNSPKDPCENGFTTSVWCLPLAAVCGFLFALATVEGFLSTKTQSRLADKVSISSNESGGAPSLKSLNIPAGSQNLELHYAGLGTTEPVDIDFRYKLEGVDEEWVEPDGRHLTNHSHLRPGEYHFKVKGGEGRGTSNEGASLAFVILPSYWQTWWFWTLCASAFILLLVGTYEMRLQAERKLFRMRLRIASDLHDEIGSNLGSISLLSEAASVTSSHPAEEMAEIRRVVLETSGSLRDIVWYLDPAADDMQELILRMESTAQTMLQGIPFEFLPSIEPKPGNPSLQLRRNILPMFKEILHNILKHARARQVSIWVNVSLDQFVLTIADDGCGFLQSRETRGNGLRNLRRRMNDVGGELNLWSQIGSGTKVSLIMPIK